MKVRFYLLDGDTNASSRQRVLQYVPFLRRHGIEPLISRPVPAGVYDRLVEHGSGRLGEKAAFYSLFAATRLRDVLRASSADVVVVQRDLFPFGPPLVERLLWMRNPRLVYDTDDATYLRPAFTPDTPFQRLRRFDKVAELAAHARWVSAATAPIAAWARQFTPHVSVVPMAIDPAEYGAWARPAGVTHSGPLVVGWAGTPGGLGYLEALAPVLRAVAASQPIVVRVISGGAASVRLPGVPVERWPWRATTALADLATFDIGLVPLADTPFEQAKFPFKLLQYLALGVPTLSARVGIAQQVLEDGTNGLLAGTSAEWQAKLERLIGDMALRSRLSEQGRATVAASYTLEAIGPRLVDGLSRVAAG